MKAQKITTTDNEDLLIITDGDESLVPGFPELPPTHHDHEVVEREDEWQQPEYGSDEAFLAAFEGPITGDGTGEALPPAPDEDYLPGARSLSE